jgi:hypothetical protein
MQYVFWDEVGLWNEEAREALDQLWQAYLRRVDWPEPIPVRLPPVTIEAYREPEPINLDVLMAEIEKPSPTRYFLNRWVPNEVREDRYRKRHP